MQVSRIGNDYARRNSLSPYSVNKVRKLSKRPNSYVTAIQDNSVILTDVDISLVGFLPRELWLTLLVNYGLSAVDLANLEIACKWFNVCWGEGQSQ